ncbi:replication initiator [Streptosporangium canum]
MNNPNEHDRQERHPEWMTDLVRVINAPGYDRWRAMVSGTGGCSHPIHLAGESVIVDASTGEVLHAYRTTDEPSGHLLVACGNRRASVCAACSEVYRADTFHLIRAGLSGGKGVPETVSAHPRAFVTLTAPSFGPVHTRREKDGTVRACRPRNREKLCEHGRPVGCHARHEPGDERLGQPICPDCYDYPGAVLWQAHAGALWHRFTLKVRHTLATEAGLSSTTFGKQVRVSFAKVAEYQRRGSPDPATPRVRRSWPNTSGDASPWPAPSRRNGRTDDPSRSPRRTTPVSRLRSDVPAQHEPQRDLRADPIGPSALGHPGPHPADPSLGHLRLRRTTRTGSEGVMTARRSRGDDGLHRDETRERWIASVTAGYTPAGKRIVKKASGKTKTEAKAKLKEIIRDYEDGLVLASTDYTVGDAVKYWLEHGLQGRGNSTVGLYTEFAGNHVISALGARKLRDLSVEDVDRWLAAKAPELSTRTLKLIYGILNRSVKNAMVRDKVKRNVVDLCEVPEGREGRRSKALTLPQAVAVLTAAEQASARIGGYIVLSLLTGVRTEELRELSWSHVVAFVAERKAWLPVTEAGWKHSGGL